MKQYGLPYQGSKNQIAEWVIERLPPARHFYDLFCGGGAISHLALSKYRKVTASEINPLLTKALTGKDDRPERWISREEYREDTQDPVAAYCWSFGANLSNYIYAVELEPWKHALHLARVEGDFSELNAIGIKTDNRKWLYERTEEVRKVYATWYCKNILKSNCDAAELLKDAVKKTEERNEELRHYLCAALDKSGMKQRDVGRLLGTNMERHYFGRSQWSFPTQQYYERMQEFLDLPVSYSECMVFKDADIQASTLVALSELKSFYALESRQNVIRYLTTKKAFQTSRFELFNKSYDEIDIEPGSVVYCDPPYRNTAGYGGKSDTFDHDKFYLWALAQTELTIISEYDMPDDFVPIAQINKRNILSSHANLAATEKLFIPKHQVELYKQKQGLLFSL